MRSVVHKLTLAFALTFVWSSIGLSCPAFFLAKRIPFSKKYDYLRRNVSLFTLEGKNWKQKAIQINDVSAEGVLNFELKANSLNIKLKKNDRVTIHPEDLGASRWNRTLPPPCGAERLVEVYSHKNYGYIAFCKKKQFQLEPEIVYDGKKRLLTANRYSYEHNEKNHLNFASIDLNLAGNLKTIASHSEQLIRADVRNFFTMEFTADDISANLEHELPGSVGVLGLLHFYLKILFFSIDLSLTPEVQFYNDSLYMPMSLYSPVDASKYLNEGSGIIYSWRNHDGVVWNEKASKMPVFKEKGSFHKDVKKFCRTQLCPFTLEGKVEEKTVKMSFSLEKDLVERNFYPQVFWGISDLSQSFGESVSSSPEQRMGVFFETSKLPKGNHFWDFWISMGKDYGVCPAKIRLRPAKWRTKR